MAKITIEELSDDLKEYLNGLGLTETQVQGLIDLWVNEVLGINDLETTNKTIVGAINEVKNSIGNQDLSAYQTVEDNDLLTTNKTIVEAINEIYNSQDTVKQELVAALVAKGLQATTDESFDSLSNSINNNLVKIDGNATVSDVMTGKTFINNTGNMLTGSMVNRGSITITPNSSTQTSGAGYYTSINVSGDSNLISSNIRSGANIFGVSGSFSVPPTYKTYTITQRATLSGGTSASATHQICDPTWNIISCTFAFIKITEYAYYNTYSYEDDYVLPANYSGELSSFGSTGYSLGIASDRYEDDSSGDSFPQVDWDIDLLINFNDNTMSYTATAERSLSSGSYFELTYELEVRFGGLK